MSAVTMTRRDRIREKLADLKLPGAFEVVDKILARAHGGTLNVANAVEELLDAQLELRVQRRLESAQRTACLLSGSVSGLAPYEGEQSCCGRDRERSQRVFHDVGGSD